MNSAGRHAGPTIYFVIVVAPSPFSSTETKWFTAVYQSDPLDPTDPTDAAG
jgi:hypothetical protein